MPNPSTQAIRDNNFFYGYVTYGRWRIKAETVNCFLRQGETILTEGIDAVDPYCGRLPFREALSRIKIKLGGFGGCCFNGNFQETGGNLCMKKPDTQEIEGCQYKKSGDLRKIVWSFCSEYVKREQENNKCSQSCNRKPYQECTLQNVIPCKS